MKNNNKRLYILVSVFLIGIGLTFAYFVGKTLFTGSGATTEGRTATVNGSTLEIKGELKAGENMYPGHQELSEITATAIGDNETILYNLTWTGKNELNTELKYYVYSSDTKIDVSVTCEKKKKVKEGKQYLNEECTITGLDQTSKVSEGEIPKTEEGKDTTVIIAQNELITSEKTPGKVKYYYVIIEYPDIGATQNNDLNHGFDGKVYGEISNSKADINIIGIHVEQENGEYKKTNKIPNKDETITLNTSKSTCTNNAELNWNTSEWSLEVSNLTKSGTDCELYFFNPTPERTLDGLNQHSIGPVGAITGPSCSGDTSSSCYSSGTDNKKNNMAQNGIYETEDDYGTSYVFRGFVQNNWLKFGKEGNDDIWWRIIRINGNGTIRLIYAGKASSTTPTVTQIGTSTYNTWYNDNKYVGFMYGTKSVGNVSNESGDGITTSARDGDKPAHTNVYNSTIKDKLDEWWTTTDLGSTDQVKHIDIETGFCNDREPIKVARGSYVTTTYGIRQAGYASVDRVWATGDTSFDTTGQEPTLKCGDDTSRKYDLFTGTDAKGVMVDGKTIEGNHALTNSVGLITMDEVIYAGGFAGQNNNNYWLHTGQNYWTMTPSYYNPFAQVFYMNIYGSIDNNNVFNVMYVRPVINLSADTVFGTLKGEDLVNGGTVDNPYIVK